MSEILKLLRWLTGDVHQPKREPQFLYGPLDGLTESEARSMRFEWGTDQGVPWLQWNGHRYFHDGRDWRFCGQGVRV